MRQGGSNFVRGCDPSDKSLDLGVYSVETDFWEFKLELPSLVGAINSSALLGGYLAFDVRHVWTHHSVD